MERRGKKRKVVESSGKKRKVMESSGKKRKVMEREAIQGLASPSYASSHV